uniref:Uncharacterized protein n=1 Tax=Arundo donax TaxID=35708 RepID=A0A0A8Y866_ARUDO
MAALLFFLLVFCSLFCLFCTLISGRS